MNTMDGLNLTAAQANTLEELKRKLSGELDQECRVFDETYLFYRFLKARDWDANKAENMFKKWRKQQNIMRDYKPTEFLRTYFDNFHIGYDKEGCPLFYVPSGKFDVKGLYRSARVTDIEKFVYQYMSYHEKYLETKSKEIKRRLTGFVLIFNTDGLTFANAVDKFGFEVFMKLTKMQQDNFPERLKAVYFINVNSYFKIPFNVAKNLLTLRTLSKINVYGREGWQDELLKVIDPDQLPVFMGGTRTDTDGNPLCKTIVNHGGPIDKRYYLSKSRNLLSNSPEVKKLHISRFSSSKVPLDVKETGSVIEWEFEVKSGDIGFGLFHKDTKELINEEVPLQRLSTKDFSESGMYKCEKTGEYFVLFDNSYSWFRSKEVSYRIRILDESELEDQING